MRCWGIVLFGLAGCSSNTDRSPLEGCSTHQLAWTDEDGAAAEAAAQECQDAGLSERDCDRPSFITREQALCAAAKFDAPVTADGLRVSLVFASVTKRVVWDVAVRSSGRADHRAIDALSGDLLRKSTSTSID
jgi:hypothetical protein